MEDFYDPDLEARLYAEVHYTNDTFSDTNNEPKSAPRGLPAEGDVTPGGIRSYAKKTGMFPKKHRALIDGVRTMGAHRGQEQIPRQEFRSNQSDVTRTIPSLLNLDTPIPPISTRFVSPNSSRFPPSISSRFPPSNPARFPPSNPPRFPLSNSPRFPPSNPPRFPPSNPSTFPPSNPPRFPPSNPPRFNSPSPSRFTSPNPTGFPPSNPSRFTPQDLARFNLPDPGRPSLLGRFPSDFPRSVNLINPPPYVFNRGSNFQINPFASDNFNQNLVDPYASPRQDLPRFNQQDFIRLNQPSPNKSKAQSRKDSHMANLKNFSKKVRNQRRREKTKRNRKSGRRNSVIGTSSSTPRKNPNRAARHPDLNKSCEDVVNLDDSVEVIEILESTDDNLTQSDRGSQASHDESGDEVDKSEQILGKSDESSDGSILSFDKSDENLEKFDEHLKTQSRNLDKSDHNVDKSKNLDASNKGLDKSDENLKSPCKNLDKSNKNLDKSDGSLRTPTRNLDKLNKNLDKFDHNLDEFQNLETPNKNLDKSDGNLTTPSKNLDKSNKSSDKSNQNLDKSNKNLDKSNRILDKSKNLEISSRNLDKSDGNLMTPSKNLDKSNKNLDKSDGNSRTPTRNLTKSNQNLDKSNRILDKSKNLETPNKSQDKSDENLKTPTRNLDRSNKSLNKSHQNLEKSNKNLDKSDENLDKSDNSEKSKNLDTPNKNLDKSKHSDNQGNLISKSSPEPSSNDKNSKYNIKSPTKISKSMASLESSSDSESDESIFEVPVPPKPAPPLINLNDSDESDNSDSEEDSNDVSSKSNVEEDKDDDDEEEEEKEDEDEGEEDENSSSRVENSNSEKQIWDCDDDDDDDENDNDNDGEEDRIETNFVLNCTQVQKSVPTLEELRRVNLTNLEGDDDSPELETEEIVIDNNDSTANASTAMTMMTTEDSGDKSKQPGPRSLGSEKKRPREESRSRNESLKPIKVPRSDGNNENTSFEEYVSKPMPESLRAFYSEARSSECENDVMDVQSQMSRNPNRWAILDADLVCRGGDRRPRCSYCHQPGHKREHCPDKKKHATCHMCGEEGHVESRCPQKMCLTCGKKFSSYRKTCEYCRKLHCALCKGVGHLKINCPDLWRRYHQTTTSEAIKIPPDPQKVLKPAHKLSCCNCTRRGHDSSTCTRYRWSPHFPSPISVTSYTDGPSYPARDPPQFPPEEPQIHIIDPVPPSQEEILYLYQNYLPTSENWSSETIYPLEIPNISYDLESSKHQFPEFLAKHFPRGCPYLIDVQIKLMVPNKLAMELKTPTVPSTLELKKLIIQWMSRKAVDRKKMVAVKRLPISKAAMLDTMRDKFYNFITCSSFRGLTAYDEDILSKKKENFILARTQKKKPKSGMNDCQLIADMEQRYLRKLLCSLYNFKVAPSAEEIINDFQKLLDLLTTDGAWEGDNGPESLVPQWIYMNFCWFNFELFTIHLSDYIIQAKNLLMERLELVKARNVKRNQWSGELGLQLMVGRAERRNFRSDKCMLHILKSSEGKQKRRELNTAQSSSSGSGSKKKKKKGKNNDSFKKNDDGSKTICGSRNNEGSKNSDSSRNSICSKNNDGSKNSGGARNSTGSKNNDGSRNHDGSRNSEGSKNNDGSRNNNGSKKPKENSLIIDGKINMEVLQREKLACRAQAAVDLAKKHGLKDYVERAEMLVKKIKDGGMVRKNSIEQLWNFMVKELRGNNISVHN